MMFTSNQQVGKCCWNWIQIGETYSCSLFHFKIVSAVQGVNHAETKPCQLVSFTSVCATLHICSEWILCQSNQWGLNGCFLHLKDLKALPLGMGRHWLWLDSVLFELSVCHRVTVDSLTWFASCSPRWLNFRHVTHMSIKVQILHVIHLKYI